MRQNNQSKKSNQGVNRTKLSEPTESIWLPRQETEAPSYKRRERPILVTILAVLITAIGLLHILLMSMALATGFYAYAYGTSGLDILGMAFPFILLIGGIVLTFSGYGLWHMRLWAWKVTIVMVIILWALMSPTVICFFPGLILVVYLLLVRDDFMTKSDSS